MPRLEFMAISTLGDARPLRFVLSELPYLMFPALIITFKPENVKHTIAWLSCVNCLAWLGVFLSGFSVTGDMRFG